MRSSALLLTVLFVMPACSRTPETKPDVLAQGPEPPPSSPSVPSASGVEPQAPTSYKLASFERLVAIGDLHGDLRALRGALQLGGAIDSDDRWVGKNLTVVQTGDQLDRGDQDREVLDVIEKLEQDAKAAGGAFVVLNGNHELMNASFDFRYVSRKSFASFSDFVSRASGAAARVPDDEKGRAAAFAPGAAYAQKLARHLTVAMVGETLFAHGGVLPAHVDYGLDRLNGEAQSFLAGRRASLPPALSAEDSPVWTRFYGGAVDGSNCEVLGRVLQQTGAKRLVVGHTVQKDGINGACQNRLFRIDVGLSAYYGDRPPQVLEITAAGARILDAAGASPGNTPRKKSQAGEPALHSEP
jgi:hypothetical protein